MSAQPFKPVRIPSLKTVGDFRAHVASLGIELPCEDNIAVGDASPLTQAVTTTTVNSKTIGNRWAIHPMEGWDGTATGAPTEDTVRRWQRFGESGAKLIFGGEAMAVRPDGRANPNQLIINKENAGGIATLRDTLLAAHQKLYGTTDDLVIGFQLTHSGRFCRPIDKKRLEPRVAYRHPILDKKFGVSSDAQIFTDGEIERLIEDYVAAAKIAREAGADFVDIKHCHGYLLHEFLGAFTRPGKYGGSFENRTSILREIVAGIRASGNPIEIGVRLSAFDFVPFRPDPALSRPGKLGPGIPEDYSHCLPYRYAFGCDVDNPVEPDLAETFRFMDLCAQLGVKIQNLSAGSPYYNPHIQRPALYPPSDGYQPAHDPLIDCARQIQVVRQLKARASRHLILVGTAYTYLQEYLPHVAQYVLRHGWTDMIGLGRMVLAYPAILADATRTGALQTKLLCRTFSDCTTAPRNGIISGCYPLDKHYAAKPEFQRLKEIKKAVGA
ncbi:MAG: NADH:flavin oxidoreductase [Verrucomicrobia bacterium]|nr:NADH:flavin oxidoreductase [Verrucomicrobiota bacterium]